MLPCDNSSGLWTWLPSALKLWQIKANLLRLPFGPLAGGKAKLFSPETGEIQ